MGRHNGKLEGNVELLQKIGSGFHDRKVTVASHNDTYHWFFHTSKLNPFEAAEKEISFNLCIFIAVTTVNRIFSD